MKKRDYSDRKSQAAIFLIAALVILIFGILYFYYQKISIEKTAEPVQPEVLPIKVFVEGCIKNIAEDGLERIGITGGYINIPQNIKDSPRSYLAASPDSILKIPYWWHDGISSVPTEEFINKQLRDYVQSELKGCLNNFESFKDKYQITELKQPIASVLFNDNDVFVSLKYPLDISLKSGNFRASREEFAYSSPIRFRKTYELAKLIMERENTGAFLEKKTIDLYSMDTEIPTTDIAFSCKTKTWALLDIKKELQKLLNFNLPYIRIKGTDYNPELYVPTPEGKNTYSNTYYQSHYIWELQPNQETSYNNMKVSFSYDNWPINVYARPSENGILKSNAEKGTKMLSFFCMHTWHFTYDINYPVLVSVFDQETISNKAYRFSFPFKVNVDHNTPLRDNTGTASFEPFADTTSDEFCNDVKSDMTIFTVNNATGEDIRGVNLTFACGRFYCDMGHTGWLSFGASAGLTKKFPYCVNGVIKASKEGFADGQSFIQTDTDKSYVLMMNPLKQFKKYKVVKHMLSSPSVSRELEPNEKATIIITGLTNGFEGFASYPLDVDSPLQIPEGKDAKYQLSIYLADDENLLGGYLGNWTIKKDDLTNADEIIFHVVEQGLATEDERVLFISGLEPYSKLVPLPEIKQS